MSSKGFPTLLVDLSDFNMDKSESTVTPKSYYYEYDDIAYTDTVHNHKPLDETYGYHEDNTYIEFHNSSHERGFMSSANFGTLITVSNILSNLLLILLILLQRTTRVHFAYQQVLNLALSGLAFSVLVDPFTVYYDLQPWHINIHYCVAWLVLDVVLPFVSFLTLILLNFDRLVFAFSTTQYHRTFHRLPVRLLVLAAPWVVGGCLLVPLWLKTGVTWPFSDICMYGIIRQAAVASAILSLYLPAVLLIVVTVLVLVTLIGGMPQDLNELTAGGTGASWAGTGFGFYVPGLVRPGPGGAVSNGATAGPEERGRMNLNKSAVKRYHRSLAVALCILNLASVIMQLPFGAISMLEPECIEHSCESTLKLLQALSWMRSFTYTLRATFLICLTQIRRACCLACGQDSSPMHNASSTSVHKESERLELASVKTTLTLSSNAKGSGTLV